MSLMEFLFRSNGTASTNETLGAARPSGSRPTYL